MIAGRVIRQAWIEVKLSNLKENTNFYLKVLINLVFWGSTCWIFLKYFWSPEQLLGINGLRKRKLDLFTYFVCCKNANVAVICKIVAPEVEFFFFNFFEKNCLTTSNVIWKRIKIKYISSLFIYYLSPCEQNKFCEDAPGVGWRAD